VAVKSPEVHRDSGLSAGSRDSEGCLSSGSGCSCGLCCALTEICGDPRLHVSTGISSNASADRVGQVERRVETEEPPPRT